MSREACTKCGEVVSTTSDPNPHEGVFLSLEQLEALEFAINASESPSTLLLRGKDGELRKVGARRLVLCEACLPEERE